MKKFLFTIVSLSCMTYAHAWSPPDFATSPSPDTKQVLLSTNIATPTQILTVTPYAQRTWIINPSTVAVFIIFSSTNTTAPVNGSTTASFALPPTPANGVAVPWSPDGVNSPYTGAAWASSNPAGSQTNISVFRVK